MLSIVGYGNPTYACVFNSGDSSPASDHGSPLKRTVLESVSTDLHALSRGFIPVEIMVTSGIETRHTGEIVRNKFRNTGLVTRNLFRDYTGCVVGYGNPTYACVCNGGDSSPASAHGSPLKRTVIESVSTDLHALSRGFIPGEIMVMLGT